MKKLLTNLTFWVLTAITCGVLLGHFNPEFALQPILEKGFKANLWISEFEIKTTFSELLSSIFISIVKLFINPIIFLTITLGIISMGDLKKVGKVGAKALIYFEVVTTIALLIGVVVANIIRPGDGVVTDSIKGGDISKYTQSAEAFNWMKFFWDNVTLQVLVVSIMLGIFLSNSNSRRRPVTIKLISILVLKIVVIVVCILFQKYLDLVEGYPTVYFFVVAIFITAFIYLIVSIIQDISLFTINNAIRKKCIDFLSPISKKVFWALHKVMLLAPVGAFGGMAFTIAKYGIKTLLPLAKLMGTVYVTMACFIFIVLWYILRTYKIKLWSYLKYIREELLIVLGTSSSEAGLPSLMEKLERMGCSKSVVGLVVPAGYSFNLDGTTIYLSMAIIFLAQVFNVHLSLEQMLTIIGILMVTSKGAAGVTGSGFIVLASTLTAIKVIPVEGLALLLGVDRFMSEARAITNFIGNGVATIWLANNEKEFDRRKMNYAFGHVEEAEDIVKGNLD